MNDADSMPWAMVPSKRAPAASSRSRRSGLAPPDMPQNGAMSLSVTVRL